MYLSLDRNLVSGDEVVRSSSFPACRHDGGRGCRSTVLRDDHYCDVVWWSEVGGAARDMVDMVRARQSCSGHGRRGRSSAELLGTWLTWLADNSMWARTARLVCDYHSPIGSLSAHLMSESPKKSSRCISRIDVVQVPNS